MRKLSTNRSIRRKLALLLAVVMIVTTILPSLPKSIFAQEGMGFEETIPADVPDYYKESETKEGLYEYKKNDGNTYFRVHGTVDGGNEGFYDADSSGNPTQPYELLDQDDESNKAYNSGTESNIAEDLVDNEAFISELSVAKIVDGTKGFDKTEGAGNDTGDSNKIVRTFDTVTYTLYYVNRLQNQTTTTYFRNGYLHVRFELPCSFAEARFDVENMTWLLDAQQKEENGKVVLTGKRYLTAGTSKSIIPGDGELSVIINVLGMKNGDTIEPTFTAWMQGNPKSQEKIIINDDVKVSAAPSYNIQLLRNGHMQAKNTYDFSTGNANAVNKDKGSVTGRIYGYGVTLQLMNPDATKGLKGIELPKGQITFDLNLKVEKGTTDITGTGSGQLMPLLWDYKGNDTAAKGTQGRPTGWYGGQFELGAFGVAPYNNVPSGSYANGCVNGGNWSASQTGATISVTVDAYTFLTTGGNYYWPTHNLGIASSSTPAYGENLGIGCFSAGYFQILFPFPEKIEDSDIYYFTVSDDNLKASSLTDVNVTNGDQKKKTDDSARNTIVLTTPGAYDKSNYFTKASQSSSPWSSNLSSSKAGQGADGWTTPGDVVEIWGGVSNNATNDFEMFPHAFNILQKFDDEGFQPLADADGTLTAINQTTAWRCKLLYAAKPGGAGWDSDSEMNLAVEEDLEYFATMADLKAKYPNGVCVAVLIEGRESYGGPIIGFNVQVLDTAEVGKVYQTTNTVRIWTEEKGSLMTQADSRLSEDPAVIAKLSTQDAIVDGTKPNHGPYVKTEYDESGQVKTGTHAPLGYRSGASLLMVGIEAAITKSVDQLSGSTPKSTYDMGAGQRRVDYVLSPSVVLAGGKQGTAAETTTVTIIDTLPKGVSVTPSTKYYQGGSYTQDASSPLGGTLTGGAEIALEEGYPLLNDNGTTTLKWVIENVLPGEPMEKIHFSANIGVPGDDSQDVADGNQLENKVTIQADGDGRAIHGTNKNIATYTIRIIKLGQASLVKMVETPIVELGEDIVYNITHNNVSSNDMNNYKLLDILPFNGDSRGSKIDGSYETVVKIDLSGSKAATEIKVLASTDNFTNETANTVNEGSFTALDTISGGSTKTITLPSGTTAVLLKGTLAAKDGYSAEIILKVSGNKTGNVYGNDATAATGPDDYILAPSVSAVVVKRTIKGLAWLDVNRDGLQSSNEPKLPNVKVSLIDESTGLAATDVYGNPVASIDTKADGSYLFENLGQGDYTVRFEGSTQFKIGQFEATKLKAGNVKLDSDMVGLDGSDGKLARGDITGIKLPEKEKVSPYGYVTAYNDGGFIGGEPVKVPLTGTKTLTGGGKGSSDITADQFTFTMKSDAGNDAGGFTGLPTGEIGVKAGGDIDFGTLTFTNVGVYKFTIEEVDGNAAGYGYDKKSVEVTVTITLDTQTSKLKSSITYKKAEADKTGITFENTYTTPDPVKLSLEGDKTLTGGGKTDADITAGQFKFTMTAAAANDKTGYTGLPIGEVEVKAGGDIDYGTLTFSKVGTYVFTITEVDGGAAGYTYDKKPVTVTVTVKLNTATNKLEASAAYQKDGTSANGIAFANTYLSPDPVTVLLIGTKSLTGGGKTDASITKDQFKFKITAGLANDTTGYTGLPTGEIGVNAGGTIQFATLSFTKVGTYTFTISEVDGKAAGYTYDNKTVTVTVVVTLNVLTNKLESKITYEKDGEKQNGITFENTYTAPDAVKLSLEGDKTLTGGGKTEADITAGQFKFTMTEAAANDTTGYTGLPTGEIGVKAGGDIDFGTLTFSKAGTYVFTITEVNSGAAGFTYDKKPVTVTATVTLNTATNKLEVSAAYEKDGTGADEITFANTYTYPDAVEVILAGTKSLTGGGKTDTSITKDQFKFTITEASTNDTTGYTGLPTGEVGVNAGGNIDLATLSFTKTGTYTFTIREVDGQAPGYTYDDKSVTVTVVVTLNTDTNKFETKVSYEKESEKQDGIAFENTYTLKPVTAALEGKKELTGRNQREDEFKFQVLEGETVVATGVNKADGTIEFTPITYEETGSHSYVVTEVVEDLKGVTYDPAEFKVSVEVTDNGDGTMTASVTYEDDAITYHNSYSPFAVKQPIGAEKKVTGDIPEDDAAFTFELTSLTDGAPMPSGSTGGSKVVTRKGAGSIVFGDITYSETGLYEYEVSEAVGTELGYTYDETIYKVTVEVTDDEEGQLHAAMVITNQDTEDLAENLVFINEYEEPEEEIDVVKSDDKGLIKGGDVITYEIKVSNTGNVPLVGIIVRDYMPEYTTYVSVENDGVYAVIGGKEAVTWYIEKLEPGEEVTVSFQAKVDECLPEGYVVHNTALYEVTGNLDPKIVNDEEDPNVKTNKVENKLDPAYVPPTDGQGGNVATGDTGNMYTYAAVIGLSAFVIILVVTRKEKIKKTP